MEETKASKNSTKKIIVITTSVVVIILIVLLGLAMWGNQLNERDEEQLVELREQTMQTIDTVSEEKFDIQVADSLQRQEVRQMPEFVLASPEATWFTQQQMQVIGYNLGLSNKASVENYGEQVVWYEEVKTLMINPTIGSINFTTAFNLADISLPTGTPNENVAMTAFQEFVENSNLPMDFYDLENVEYQYQVVDDNGSVDPSFSGQGQLLRMSVPYKASEVKVLLPFESYLMVDAEGTIHLLSLFVPNIRQTDQTITLAKFSQIKDRLDGGASVVIGSNIQQAGPLQVQQAVPAYYMNIRQFYSLKTQRAFVPIYIFEGDDGSVAVLAQ